MIYSMTGYGRAGYDYESKFDFQVEIKTVNNKFLDINIKIPKQFMALEDGICSIIKDKISRGKVDVYINILQNKSITPKIHLNDEYYDNYVEILEHMKNKYGMKESIKFSDLLSMDGVFQQVDVNLDFDEVFTNLRPKIISVMNDCIEMRLFEGKRLGLDMVVKCNEIIKCNNFIKEKQYLIKYEFKKKLEEKVNECLNDKYMDENRLLQEIIIYSEKYTIDEELTRIDSHTNQILEALKGKEIVGRKIDFILQELNREANTICSKSQNIDVTNLALEMKLLIEKIREQVQNLE